MEKGYKPLPYLPTEIKIMIIERVNDIDIRRYFRVYSKIPKNDFRYEMLDNKKPPIEQKIGGPEWVGYHPRDCGYYGEVILKKEFFASPINAYNMEIKIVELKISVLSIDDSTQTQNGHVDSAYHCDKEDEKISWSLYNYSPEKNFVYNCKDFYIT